MVADSAIPCANGSPFLRIPLETRQQIYRYLLLDPPESYLSTPWHQVKGNKEKDSEEEYLVKKYPKRVQDAHESIWNCGLEEGVNVRRFPAILLINRQIYDEASYLFYSELEVNLQPGDVLCMKTSKDMMKASERLWRHNPLYGTGTTDSTGLTVYSKPESDGVMEPHVLARFKRINFEFDCNWEDKAKLLSSYKHSTMIHQLVRIVLNSPRLFRFHMTLNIEVLPRYDNNLDSDSHHKKEGDKSNVTLRNTKKVIANH